MAVKGKSLAKQLVKKLLKEAKFAKRSVRPKKPSLSSEGKWKLMIRPDEMAIDLLSVLPDLCLTEVFKDTTKQDRFNVMMAYDGILSRKMSRCLKGMASGGKNLSILKTEKGHGITLLCPDSDRDLMHKLELSYFYEIFECDDGSIREEFWNNLSGPNNKTLRKPLTKLSHTWSVPPEFFIALTRILRNFRVKHVHIEQIQLDLDLLMILETMLASSKVESLICSDVTCTGSTNRLGKSFAQIIKTIESVTLKRSPQLNSLVNEELINDISESALTEFKCDVQPDTVDYIFYPDRSLLPRLARFTTIEAVGMVLNANWVVKLVLDRLARDEPCLSFGDLRFGMETRITKKMVTHHLLGYAGYTYTECGRSHYITRTESRLTARLTTFEYDDFCHRKKKNIHVAFVNFSQSTQYV